MLRLTSELITGVKSIMALSPSNLYDCATTVLQNSLLLLSFTREASDAVC
jgi:hypothetical protein